MGHRCHGGAAAAPDASGAFGKLGLRAPRGLHGLRGRVPAWLLFGSGPTHALAGSHWGPEPLSSVAGPRGRCPPLTPPRLGPSKAQRLFILPGGDGGGRPAWSRLRELFGCWTLIGPLPHRHRRRVQTHSTFSRSEVPSFSRKCFTRRIFNLGKRICRKRSGFQNQPFQTTLNISIMFLEGLFKLKTSMPETVFWSRDLKLHSSKSLSAMRAFGGEFSYGVLNLNLYPSS